ncbi:Alanyl-tRNA synthetase family protein [Acidisarcina polymorpha]|uniref:Alanine--tRNA ligase n=1 Tax=Acidisarcina polymorpha TaxID=2211140 RepID=A0A2Z5FXD8_9BACT|nr:DHHA1 domain-containing protein [Acidisarcina polymorpha]AXC11056.1 Alanyl-tRNA synthetase family protein [Acidisarcina polymorpha]
MVDRLYYTDSFLTRFDAVVTDIRLVSRTGGEALWQVALDRSAFYPTSGGQPFDKGNLTATSRNGAVLEVAIDEVSEDEQGEVWHYTTKPLVAGTEVQATIDWQRRLDHMQQHSGQHLLSAIFSRELGAHTVSFHLGEESSTIDLNTASIAHASIERMERIANEIIAQDRSVSIRTVSREQADALLAAGQLRKLPEREGDIRLIEIEGIDLNACGGTHVRSTGQIGGLAVRSTEKVRHGLRVEFVCGLRAVAAARRDFSLLAQSAAALSISASQVPQSIERMLAETKQAAKDRQKLREEIARYEAADLLTKAFTHGGVHIVRHSFVDHDADYIKVLASKLTSNAGAVALLSSTQQEPASVVFARSADLKFSCGELLKSALVELGLRGGGSSTMAQGEVPHSALKTLFDRLEATARASTLPEA